MEENMKKLVGLIVIAILMVAVVGCQMPGMSTITPGAKTVKVTKVPLIGGKPMNLKGRSIASRTVTTGIPVQYDASSTAGYCAYVALGAPIVTGLQSTTQYNVGDSFSSPIQVSDDSGNLITFTGNITTIISTDDQGDIIFTGTFDEDQQSGYVFTMHSDGTFQYDQRVVFEGPFSRYNQDGTPTDITIMNHTSLSGSTNATGFAATGFANIYQNGMSNDQSGPAVSMLAATYGDLNLKADTAYYNVMLSNTVNGSTTSINLYDFTSLDAACEHTIASPDTTNANCLYYLNLSNNRWGGFGQSGPIGGSANNGSTVVATLVDQWDL
jgi:hypothetical protein